MLAQFLTDLPLESLLARAPDCAIGAYLHQITRWSGAAHGYPRMLLALGHSFTAQALPPTVERGTVGQCFANAGLLAVDNPELTYVEGLADCGFLPTAHAWCVDREGRVIDPTWRDCATAAYFGIAVSADALQEHLQSTGYWGLFDGVLPRRLLDGRLSEFLHPDWVSDDTRALLPQCFA
jgi:hypothetical protein